jgi:hypothetical protein
MDFTSQSLKKAFSSNFGSDLRQNGTFLAFQVFSKPLRLAKLAEIQDSYFRVTKYLCTRRYGVSDPIILAYGLYDR